MSTQSSQRTEMQNKFFLCVLCDLLFEFLKIISLKGLVDYTPGWRLRVGSSPSRDEERPRDIRRAEH